MTQARGRRTLGELLRGLPTASLSTAVRELTVAGIAFDSRRVRRGDVFVALRGSRLDGHRFLEDAVRRGAAAVVVEAAAVGVDLPVPVVRVGNSRPVLARMAANWHGRPAERLRLVGVTGTVGKTTVLKMLEAILRADGLSVGTIGTLGVSGLAHGRETGYTAPDPLLLHEALAELARRSCELVAMEVTSHALDQDRVHGLSYDLGIFTNLMPLEHADYHGSFRRYVEVKCRFLGHLRPEAPLVYADDDEGVRRIALGVPARPVGCGSAAAAGVRVEAVQTALDGTAFVLNAQDPIPRWDGGCVDAGRLHLRVPLLGRASAVNATLAAVAGLSLGARPAAVRRALQGFTALSQRMNVVYRGRFLVMGDAANHPDAVSALFQVVERIPARRIHAVFAIRGRRGTRINGATAQALAIWTARTPLQTLVLTRSADVVGERDRVERREADAARSALRRAGIPFEEAETLDEAVPVVLDRARDGDLVLLLGTQGMSGGAERVRRWLEERGMAPPEEDQVRRT